MTGQPKRKLPRKDRPRPSDVYRQQMRIEAGLDWEGYADQQPKPRDKAAKIVSVLLAVAFSLWALYLHLHRPPSPAPTPTDSPNSRPAPSVIRN